MTALPLLLASIAALSENHSMAEQSYANLAHMYASLPTEIHAHPSLPLSVRQTAAYSFPRRESEHLPPLPPIRMLQQIHQVICDAEKFAREGSCEKAAVGLGSATAMLSTLIAVLATLSDGLELFRGAQKRVEEAERWKVLQESLSQRKVQAEAVTEMKDAGGTEEDRRKKKGGKKQKANNLSNSNPNSLHINSQGNGSVGAGEEKEQKGMEGRTRKKSEDQQGVAAVESAAEDDGKLGEAKKIPSWKKAGKKGKKNAWEDGGDWEGPGERKGG